MTEDVKKEKIEEADVEKDREEEKQDIDDGVADCYANHGGDPRKLDINHCVVLSYLSSDLLTDTYDQFLECIKNLLAEEYKIDPSHIKDVVRIPKLASDAPNEASALRVILCFSEKTHKHRMMGRKKDVENNGMKVETHEELPAEYIEIGEDYSHQFDEYEMADEAGEDDDHGDVNESHELDYNGSDDEANHKGDESGEHELIKQEGKDEDDKSENGKKSEEKVRKKVYEDEDEKAPFEINWEGAPEFQWRICEKPRDERRLIIEKLLWADLHHPFIYRCVQRASSADIQFPVRYSSDGTRPAYGKVTLTFPGWVAIMDEALKHLIYFRCGDGRRIKIYLPQTTQSLKRKEEFEKKLGRVIKPTPRMLQLIVKILPEGHVATLDEACSWFPYQAVIGCEMVQDEMGQSCAIVSFETAEEAVAAHASKSFIKLETVSVKKDDDGNEKEEKKTINCNIFMRGVETHFGSLLTIYDQKKKAFEERGIKESSVRKRPISASIRAPPKRGRGASSSRGRRGGRPGPPSTRGRSPPRSRGPPPKRGHRSDPRPATYRPSSYASVRNATIDRRGDMTFGEKRFDDRGPIDPFSRPSYGYPSYGGGSSDRFGGSYDSRRRY